MLFQNLKFFFEFDWSLFPSVRVTLIQPWLGDNWCRPRGRLNINISSYQYRDTRVKNKTGFHDRLIFPIPGNDGLYIETGPRSQSHYLDQWWPFCNSSTTFHRICASFLNFMETSEQIWWQGDIFGIYWTKTTFTWRCHDVKAFHIIDLMNFPQEWPVMLKFDVFLWWAANHDT